MWGGRALVRNLPGIDRVATLTNTSIVELDMLPQHRVVVGGSYVGLEFAQMYRRFGAAVTIGEMAPRLIAREDEQISAAVKEILEAEGVAVRLDAECIRFEPRGAEIPVGLQFQAGKAADARRNEPGLRRGSPRSTTKSRGAATPSRCGNDRPPHGGGLTATPVAARPERDRAGEGRQARLSAKVLKAAGFSTRRLVEHGVKGVVVRLHDFYCEGFRMTATCGRCGLAPGPSLESVGKEPECRRAFAAYARATARDPRPGPIDKDNRGPSVLSPSEVPLLE